MLFPTLDFALFFLVVFTLAWALTDRPQLRKTVLVVASYVFYAWWDWRFMGLLLGSTLVNWAAGMILARVPTARRKLVVGIAVAIDLSVLGFFKYFNFFTESLNTLATHLGLQAGLPFLTLVLPVGISFFTFHGISYVVDLYRGQIKRPAGLLDMLLYISFFPQLVAGPIVRASHFLPQLQRPVDSQDIRATFALLLILGGLFKKVIVANDLATLLVDPVFMDPSRYGAADMGLATYGYAMQIYCDFSAYTDIAIGVAALFGYRFPQNFNQPYRAQSLRDFWRRWHISLSSWLRDYLYIPLGGSRQGKLARSRNLMITMLLGGLWHGAAWNFVLWGGIHGAGQAVEQLGRDGTRTQASALPPPRPWWRQALGVFITFHIVCAAWILFRAGDMEHVFAAFGALTRWGEGATLATPLVLVLTLGTFSGQFLPADRVERLERLLLRLRLPVAAGGMATALAILVIDACGPDGVPPFIYFRF